MLFGKQINRYYLKHAPMLILGIIVLIAVDYFQLVVPELYKKVVDGLNYGQVSVEGGTVPFDMDFLLDEVCLPLIGVILIMVTGRFLWRICFFGTGIRVETDLRERMFDHCKDLSQQYYQTNKVGTLMALFTNDLETVQDCFGMGVLSFCDALFLGGLALVKMFMVNPYMMLLSLIPMAFLLIVSTVVGKALQKRWDTRQAAFSSLSDFSQESFSGIAVVKAFVKETAELMAFRKLNLENEKANVDYTRYSTILHISVMLFVESVICVILGYGGYLVHEGTLTPGELMEFIGYFTAIVWPIMAVSQLIEMKSRGKASLDRITELLEAPVDVKDADGVQDVETLTGDIRCENLTFRYPGGGYDVLENISFHISAGENVGIIGKTGAGKTTLVDLLLRTYNVPDGTVFLDGHDVNTIPITTVRKFAAYVPQDNFLFSDTIANNIAFASESESEELIKMAAELSDVHDNISQFSLGYETVLGERGVTVSGGQKQRISIARALMKDANILILDDSVSAVDVKTEKKILENLRAVRKGKTTILIAHRITTVEQMDKILFLEDGKLVAVGTHKELCETCPAYLNMVKLQELESSHSEQQAKEEADNV